MSAALQLENPLRPLIKEIVREVLAELAPPKGGEEYSSVAPAEGVNRRSHNTRCASGKVDGARREGRIWRCSRKAWHQSFVGEVDGRSEDAYSRRLKRGR